MDEFPYPCDSHQLQAGEMIVMITDGVTEAMNAGEELYGRDPMFAFLSGIDGETGPREVVDGLYADVKRFTGDTEASDDLTILAIHYEGGGA